MHIMICLWFLRFHTITLHHHDTCVDLSFCHVHPFNSIGHCGLLRCSCHCHSNEHQWHGRHCRPASLCHTGKGGYLVYKWPRYFSQPRNLSLNSSVSVYHELLEPWLLLRCQLCQQSISISGRTSRGISIPSLLQNNSGIVKLLNLFFHHVNCILELFLSLIHI